MAHYTLASGKRSQTITSRCPICLQVQYHEEYIELFDNSVCCSAKCFKVYEVNLFKLYSKACKWADDKNIASSPWAIISQYLIEEGG